MSSALQPTAQVASEGERQMQQPPEAFVGGVSALIETPTSEAGAEPEAEADAEAEAEMRAEVEAGEAPLPPAEPFETSTAHATVAKKPSVAHATVYKKASVPPPPHEVIVVSKFMRRPCAHIQQFHVFVHVHDSFRCTCSSTRGSSCALLFVGSTVETVESSSARAAEAAATASMQPALSAVPSASPSPLASPSPSRPQVAPRHEGPLVRKHEWESATLKSTHRNWKQLHATLDGDRLSFFTEMKHAKSVRSPSVFLLFCLWHIECRTSFRLSSDSDFSCYLTLFCYLK